MIDVVMRLIGCLLRMKLYDSTSVQVVLSGSAPIQDHVIQWFRAVLGVNIIEGYGQTESTAATTVYLFGDTIPGEISLS